MSLNKNKAPKYQRMSGEKHDDIAGEINEWSEAHGLAVAKQDTAGRPMNYRNTWASFILVLILVVTWVMMAECLQGNDYIESHEAFMRYVVVSSYSITVLVALIMEHCCGQKSKTIKLKRTLFVRTLFWTCSTGLVFMWLQGYVWYISLQETMVSLNNSLYQVQSVFVYLLSVCFLGELITIRKAFAIGIALSGVFLISFGSSDASGSAKEDNTIQGVILCLLSSFLFAIYEVTVKIVEEKHHDKEYPIRDSMYFLGYCGVFCLLIGPIVLFICHQLGWEHFEFPPDKESLYSLIEICVLDLVFNAALVLGVTITSPYLVGLGMLIVIPSSFAADSYLGKMKTPVGWMQIFGVVLIVAGFLILKLQTGPISVPGYFFRKIPQLKKTIQAFSIENNNLKGKNINPSREGTLTL